MALACYAVFVLRLSYNVKRYIIKFMIESYRDKETKKLFEREPLRRIPAPTYSEWPFVSLGCYTEPSRWTIYGSPLEIASNYSGVIEKADTAFV